MGSVNPAAKHGLPASHQVELGAQSLEQPRRIAGDRFAGMAYADGEVEITAQNQIVRRRTFPAFLEGSLARQRRHL